MQSNIRDPDVTDGVNGDAVGHEEHVCPPRLLGLRGVLVQGDDGVLRQTSRVRHLVCLVERPGKNTIFVTKIQNTSGCYEKSSYKQTKRAKSLFQRF